MSSSHGTPVKTYSFTILSCLEGIEMKFSMNRMRLGERVHGSATWVVKAQKERYRDRLKSSTEEMKAGSATAPLVGSVEDKADASESKKKPRASSSSYSLSSAKSASTAEQQLESLSVSVLRAKVRYLGAEPSIIARCIEKRELVSLALELLRNSSLNSKKKSKNPKKKK
ncbi:unnamed protein product [Symbiodinium sp. CCMP2592]|nr:unnamed protein product [Symbiodinium sp. CCMP2592]